MVSKNFYRTAIIPYRKIYIDRWSSSSPSFRGYLREDTNTGKVWFLPHSYNHEVLVMDMSLSVGDTFFTAFNNVTNLYNDTCVADSIFYHNGLKNIILHKIKNTDTNKIVFIEGIGVDGYWLLPTPYQEDLWWSTSNVLTRHILCSYKNCKQVYQSPKYTCDGHTIGMSCIKDEPMFSIYPNPTNDMIYIKTSNNDIFYVKICNMSGTILKSFDMLGSSEINIKDLPKGVYLLTISNKTNISTTKIVKS